MNDVVTLSRAEHEALIRRLEELEDVVAARQVEARVAGGESEYLPSEMVDRMIAGESPIRVWREHRGLSALQLASAARISEANLGRLERGDEAGSLLVLRRLARALRVDLDDLAGVETSETL
jgi:hypothetical protein